MPETPLRLIVRLPHSFRVATPDAVRRVAELADELGFYGVSVQDHLLEMPENAPCFTGPSDPRTVYSSLTTLSWIAGFTQRIKLATTVLVAGYRHPVMLAKETATLDVLSNGRLMIGFGVGASRKRASAEGFKLSHRADLAAREFDALGVHGNRGTLADETLQVLKACWMQQAPTFHGKTVEFDDFAVFPKPVQQPGPPIVVGGRSEAALRRAALFADGWAPSHENPEHFAWGRQHVIELAKQAGRPEPTWWGASLDLSISKDRAIAVDRMRKGIGPLFETDSAMSAAGLTGTPDEVLNRLAKWRAVGLNMVDLKIVPRDLDETIEQMKLIGAEILPVLDAGEI